MSEDEKFTVTEECKVEPVGEETAAYKCGHEGPTAAVFNLYGQTYGCNPAALVGREKCPACLNAEGLKGVIRCCCCGFAILPGSGVVRYADPSSYRKEWTTIDGGAAVGCMRQNCCENPFGVSGTWNGKEVESVFGGMVIVDLHGQRGGGYGGFSD